MYLESTPMWRTMRPLPRIIAIWVILLFSVNKLCAQTGYTSNASGNWNNVNTWVKSGGGTPATPPNSIDAVVTIKAGHVINLTDARTSNTNNISGTLNILSTGSLTLANNPGYSAGNLAILTGGVMISSGAKNYGTEIVLTTGAGLFFNSKSKLIVGTGGPITGTNLHNYATAAANTWRDKAIFEWNSSTPLPDNVTYFPANLNTVSPILSIVNTGGSIGSANPLNIKGFLSVNGPFSFVGAGTKTIRNGIIGSSVLTLPVGTGNVIVDGISASAFSTPIIGGTGSGVSIIADRHISIPNGLIIPLDSTANLNSTNASGLVNKVSNHVTVTGTLALGAAIIQNTSGSVIVNGTIKTAHASGLEGGNITAPSTVNINTGSTVEYNANGNQTVTASITLEGTSKYHKIIFSGSGTKTPAGTVTAANLVEINGTAIVDATTYDIGSSTAAFTMTGGRLKLGTAGILPIMSQAYSLTGSSVVEFAGIGVLQEIRGENVSYPHEYNAIEVSGNNVAASYGDVNLRAGGSVTIKPTGVFGTSSTNPIKGTTGNQSFIMEPGALVNCGNSSGFVAVSGNSTIFTDIETVTLQAGSTINYTRAGAQSIGNTVSYQHLTLSGSGDKTAAAGTLTIQGNLTSLGTAQFLHNNGTVTFSNATSGQTYTAAQPFTFNNITIANSSATGVGFASDMSIESKLSFATDAKRLSIAAGKLVKLKSSATATAQVGTIPAALTINYNSTANFEVQRWLQEKKAWRFLATAVEIATSPTVKDAWREGGVAGSTGYGTIITGPAAAANLDSSYTSPGYSMKWFNGTEYKFVTNGLAAVANKEGYMLYVRGDRGIAPSTVTGVETNLRIKGKLRTGDQAYTIPSKKFLSVGNPYASAFSFASLANNHPGMAQYYIAWDPTLSGYYSAGGYQTFSKVDNYKPQAGSLVPGTSTMYNTSTQYPNIESGQAFYVYNDQATDVAITITEAMKADGSRAASREYTPEDRQFLRTKLFTNADIIADGNMVAFDDEFSNDYDGYDALKFTNGGENFGMLRFNKKLSVEARGPLQATDTIHYSMSNLQERMYKLVIMPENMESTNMQAFLVDRFMQTETAVSLATDTQIDFSITSNAASKAANRFYVLFKTMAVLPVSFVAVTAQRQADKSIAINWTIANEINIVKYEVERSADGSQFKTILTKNAAGLSSYNKADIDPLQGDNFYRIKAIGVGGDISYSAIVKLTSEKIISAITLTQVPVKNKQLLVCFEGQPAGSYALQVCNVTGQVLHYETVTVNILSEIKQINLPPSTAAGIYQVSVRNKNGALLFGESIIVE